MPYSALTAEQERRLGSFGGGHTTLAWDIWAFQGARGAGAGAEIVAAAAGRTGQGGRGRLRRPLPLPFPSVGPDGRPLVCPGGRARYLRIWCKANEGALLLRHVWSWRGARRAHGEHSTDGHKTGWADVRREPAARESCIASNKIHHCNCKNFQWPVTAAQAPRCLGQVCG